MKQEGEIVRIGLHHLTPEQVLMIDSTLNEFLSGERPFLRHSYTLKQLAADTCIPLHHLSAFINQRYGMRFNDFINYYRINYCKVKILNEEWRQKKLETIGEESGFHNRNTFISAFRKFTGLSPSAYIKGMK